MGDFKEYDIPDDEVEPKTKLERYTLSDTMQLFKDEDRYYLLDNKFDMHDVIYIEFKEMKKLMDTVSLIDKRLIKVERIKATVVKETYSDGTIKKKIVEDPVDYILQDEK